MDIIVATQYKVVVNLKRKLISWPWFPATQLAYYLSYTLDVYKIGVFPTSIVVPVIP